MDDRGDRRTPVNSLMARYSYLPPSQTPLSPGTGFDASLSNVPITMASSAGMSMPSFRAGQNVISDIAESVVSQTDNAHSSGKSRNRQQSMDSYSCKEDSMHGLASRDSVGNMYGYSNYMNPPGNSFVPEGMGDRADLFMSQLGLTGRLPSSSLYGSLPQDSGNHRSGESAALSPLHSAAERSILSRSVPPYLPLGTESNYVYFNPPSLSSIGAAELSLSAGMHGSLGSFVSPPPSYSPSSAASRLRTCFPTVSASSAYNLSVGAQENKQSSVTDNVSKECYDMPWNLTHAPPEWNTGRKSRRDVDIFDSQYKQKSTSPNNESEMRPVIDQSLSSNYEGNKKNEMKISSTKTETYTTTSQNGPYYRAVPQSASERMFQENDSNLMSTDFRDIASHVANNKTLPAVGSSDQSVGDESSKFASQSHVRCNENMAKRPGGNLPHFSNASTMTSQHMAQPLPGASGQSSSGPSNSAPFSITPSMYSDSSENEQSVDLISNRASQKGIGTSSKPGTCLTKPRKYIPVKETVQWKKKQQLQQAKLAAMESKAALHAYQFEDQKPSQQSEEDFCPKWQTFTKVSDLSEEEGEIVNPPRIRLVIKKSLTPKMKTSKGTSSGLGISFTKGKGRIDKRTCGICQKTFSRADSLTCHMRVHTGDRPYQCQLCDANYKIAGQLRDHVRSKHSNSRPFVCTKCGKDFAYPTARRRHEKVCGLDLSERIEFQCPTCDKGFVTAKGFSKHLQTCSPSALEHGFGFEKDKEAPFRCSACEKSFASFPSLDRHQRFVCGRIPQKGIYACEECGKMFHTRNRYITHTRRHVGEKPYKCSKCETFFYDKGTLKRHTERWHEGGGKFNCTPCGKNFFDVRTWKKHMMQQHDSQFIEPLYMMNLQGRRMKQHMCKVCGRSFIWRCLRAHVASEHPGMSLSEALSKELLKCDICSKEFSSYQILRVHKRGHCSSQRFKCEKCNMQFAVKSVLGYHIQMHCQHSSGFANADNLSIHMGVGTGDRPYQCQLCDANYKIAGHLRDHVRSRHSNSRPFLCAKCGKDFAYSTARRRHEKVCGVDLSERIQFQCSACDKGFVTAKGYTKHQVTCSNNQGENGGKIEMPFKCSSCEKSFASFPALDRHQRFICGRIPQKGIYACEECGKMFYKRDRYITHTRRHAGEKPFKCPECELCFYDQGTLKTHMERWHQSSGKYKCTLCNKDFFYPRTLKKHMHQHSVELANSIGSLHREASHGRMMRQYTCKICSKSFAWRPLCAHMAAEHPGVDLNEAVSKDLMKCDVCSKEFSCPQSLTLHKRKHSNFKRYKCEKCDLQFAMKSSFLSHCRTHADGRPHSCEECGKTFRWLHSLTHHKMTHHSSSAESSDRTIERYTCNECGKHFKQENFLYLHLKLKQHGSSQDTPCICAKCGRGFSKMPDYKTHLATHNISVPHSKPFSCSPCAIGFQTKHLLDKHMRRVHNQQPQPSYLGVDRGKTLIPKDYLKRHAVSHEKYLSGAVPMPDHPQTAPKHCMADFTRGDTSSNNSQTQTVKKNEMESHMGMQDRPPYMASTSSQEMTRDNYEGLSLPNDALPHFSTFENQNYPRHYSTFIHQTLAWPRSEEHCAEEG
ncbi:uncharacterized protein LOC143300341 [Babylonia areolata]|uniref:uncharacterized protein LOC143300341 n=1 Tax=Babylonia areolata TaxID=304850 RepID=UPI003FD14AD0